MKKHGITAALVSVFMGIVSCNDNESVSEAGTGYLDLKVTRDLALDFVPVVKSETADVIALTLIPESGETVVIPDVNSLTEPIRLKTGVYRAVATSGTDAGTAAFDSPFYYGEKQVTIRNMQNTVEEIVCTLACVKVTAAFSEAFRQCFDYTLTVSNGEASLEFSEEAGTLGKEAYFHVSDELSWRLDVVNAKNESFFIEDSYSEVAARQHYDLKFDIEDVSGERFGAGEFLITVNNSLNVKEYDMPIFIYPDIPVILGAENLSYCSGEFPETSLYEVVTTKALTSMKLTHGSAAFTALGLPQETELMNASAETLKQLSDLGIVLSFADFGGDPVETLTAEVTDIDMQIRDFAGALPIGNHVLNISATNELDLTTNYSVNISVKTPAEITSVTAWAKFAVIKGRYHTSALPSGFAVQCKHTSSDWADAFVLIQDVNTSAKTFKMMVCKLSANTNYSFRLKTAKDGGLNATSAWTESAGTIANLNFDKWTNGDVVYPYTGKNNGVWDTANEGLDLGNYNITTQESSSFISGSAVKMESKYVSIFGVPKFAAGNIYTGDFVGITTSPIGAELNWGIKFSDRPVAMKGYYKYIPKAIDRYDSAHSGLSGQMDKCQIQVALASPTSGSGDYYFFVSSGNNKFVDFSSSNSSIIAHNKIETSETITTYRHFTLPFGYRNVNTKPTYIIITCCSSYLGDYFTGGDGSMMWADEFEFIYDPSDPAMSDQQRRELLDLF